LYESCIRIISPREIVLHVDDLHLLLWCCVCVFIEIFPFFFFFFIYLFFIKQKKKEKSITSRWGNPKGLAQVVSVLVFVVVPWGLKFESPWVQTILWDQFTGEAVVLPDLCGGGALHGSEVCLTWVVTRSGLILEGFLIINCDSMSIQHQYTFFFFFLHSRWCCFVWRLGEYQYAYEPEWDRAYVYRCD